MPFEIVRNNIVDMSVDAIVNTANPRPVVGSGVDTAIHDKAGPRLLDARRRIGNIERGCSAITPAFNLNAEYVIHTVGPIWFGGDKGEVDTLRSCYESSLKMALSHNCESIAFPLISTGNYGFPKDLALKTAISTISSFLMEHEMMVYLVVFDKRAYSLSGKLFNDVQSYIDDNIVTELRDFEYGFEIPEFRKFFRSNQVSRRRIETKDDSYADECRLPSGEMHSMRCEAPAERILESVLGHAEETFSESLIRLIDEKGFKDPDVYKRANISKQHFSKIKNNKHYQPKKSTAIAFAIALRLNLDETKDLLGKAGYVLSKSIEFDLIVEYFIKRNNYDIFEINEVLFAFTDQILGS